MVVVVRPTGLVYIAQLFVLIRELIQAGASILRVWGRDPQILGTGIVGDRRGSWTGREILFYLIMYRK